MSDAGTGTAVEALAALRNRVTALERRSLAVGWLAGLSLAMALAMGVLVGAQAYVWWHAGLEHPVLHVPGALRGAHWQLSGLVLVAATIAAAIMQIPRFWLHWLAGVTAVFVLALWWMQAPSARLLLIWPSPLERLAYATHDAVPAPLMASHAFHGDVDMDSQYTGAQIALRWNDRTSLARWVPSLLDASDQFVYGLPLSHGSPATVAGWSPEVLYRLDVALHGQPTSEVALAHGRRPPATPSWRGGPTLLALAGCMALAVAGWFGHRLWKTMRQRAEAVRLALYRRQSPPPG